MCNIALHPRRTEYKTMWTVSSTAAEKERGTEIVGFINYGNKLSDYIGKGNCLIIKQLYVSQLRICWSAYTVGLIHFKNALILSTKFNAHAYLYN